MKLHALTSSSDFPASFLVTSGPLPPGASERGTTKAREKEIWGGKWDCLFPIFFTCQLPTTDPIPETGYFSCTGCTSEGHQYFLVPHNANMITTTDNSQTFMDFVLIQKLREVTNELSQKHIT